MHTRGTCRVDIPIHPEMTIALAKQITGGLSRPSKMPGPAYSLPTHACKKGAEYSKIKGSVCEKCYAKRGPMSWSSTVRAQERRLESLTRPRWVEAMVFLIERSGCEYFRWFDAGDLQGPEHLDRICDVARTLPEVKFWLPTQEAAVVRNYALAHVDMPNNLCIRLSSPFIDGKAVNTQWLTTSVVADQRDYPGAHYCPTTGKDRKQKTCGECRACWDKQVQTVVYRKH